MKYWALPGLASFFLLACGVANDLGDDLEEFEAEAEETQDDGEQSLAELEAEIEAQAEDLEIDFTMVHTRFDSDSGEFTELTPPSIERNGSSALLLRGELYALGGLKEDGNYSQSLEVYDAEADSWSPRASRPRSGFSYDVVVDELLCSVGGYRNLDEPIRREVECYDPRTDEWSEREPVPERYAQFVPVATDDQVFIPGGLDDNLDPIANNYSYDPETDTWTERAPLPFGFFLGGAVVLDAKIYLVGGFKVAFAEDEDAPKGQDMLVYDVAADKWTAAPDMPNARALYGVDAVEGHVTAFFGVSDESAPLVDFYDPASNSWFPGTDPPDPPDGGVYTYARHQGRMHLFTLASGASGGGTTSNGELWSYSVADDEWSIVGTRTEGTDALFYGVSREDALHFVGAHTSVSY